MTGFLWRKLWKNKWLMLCLILGNIILIGVVTAAPLFTNATIQRLLQEDLRRVQEEQNIFPATISLQYNFNAAPIEYRQAYYDRTRDIIWPQAQQDIGVPGLFEVKAYVMPLWSVVPAEARETPNVARVMQLAAVSGYEDNIRLIHGRMPQDGLVDGNVIEALATNWAMHNNNLLLGELMEKFVVGHRDEPMYVRIVGIYEITEDSGPFWAVADISFNNSLLLSPGIIHEYYIANYQTRYRLATTWTMVLDSTAIRATAIEHYQYTIHEILGSFAGTAGTWMFIAPFYFTITQHLPYVEMLETTIWVLQMPIFVMLALFMYMVTKQILLLDKNGISVLKSRGASRLQILGIYAYQGLVIGAISFPLGLLLGLGLCQLIGASNGFLDMVSRTALDTEVTGTVLLYGFIGFGISYLYMLVPVIGLSKVTIVEHKQGKNKRGMQKPIWQRYFLDIIAFAASLYTMYTFNLQRELMMATMHEARAFDPMLFLSSSLFIVGAGLLCLRLYPYLVRLILFVGRSRFNPSIYASMLKVVRSSGQEQFIMLFLVFTVAVGIFSAQAARTINSDNAHRIQYLAGADLMVREFWADNVVRPTLEFANPPPPSHLVYTEPDFNRFANFDEVYAMTRVIQRQATLLGMGGRSVVNDLQLMGIETQSFGDTVWFRDDLLMIHINHFLNALSLQPNGVLLSNNFHTTLGYEIGDTFTITEAHRDDAPPSSGRFVVVGFVDHWPTFVPVERTQLETGELRQEEQFLAVANFGHIQTTWGVRPYQIWMNTSGRNHQFIHDFFAEDGTRVVEFRDTIGSLVEIQSDPIVQSTNGVLTISFIMTLLLCFTGFLIYWILSIKNRLLQFGVFRAMGMGMRGIMGILMSEQILITISALIIGGVLGEITSRFFVPLVQLSYTAADQIIPMITVMNPMDYITLYGLLGFMVVLCIAVLAIYNSRVDVSQILKLGED